MIKYTKKTLSILLLLFTLYLNNSISSHLNFVSLFDCIRDDGGFEYQNALSPENYEKTDLGFTKVVDEEDDPEAHSGQQGWFGTSSGSCSSDLIKADSTALANVDVDEDGKLTEQEIYVGRSVQQLNVYMDIFLPNLYSVVMALLLLLDALVLYVVVNAWMPERMKS